MGAQFQPVKNGLVRIRIADALCAAIYSGQLRPGDPLLEMQLAREFQVSQTPIREALFQLEQLGLVRRIANKGTVVTKLSPIEVKDRLELRAQLEEMAAIKAADRLQAKDIAELQQRVADISAASVRNDYFATTRADLEFHRTVWRISGNAALAQVLDQVAAPLFAFISIVRSSRADDLTSVIHSHQDLLNALMGRDAGHIRAVVQGHFAGSYERFVQPDNGGA